MADGPPARPLLLCADDFGLSPGIDAAVAALVGDGRLGAFSCISNASRWPLAAAALPVLRPQALAGLHLNLTEGRPLSAALARHWPCLPTLPRLMMAAHGGRLPRAAVHAELDAQWAAFVDASGSAPDFLDGHQHVHHLPGVRDWVLRQAQAHRLPVRSTAVLPGPGPALKRWLIERSGGRALGRALLQRGLLHNPVLLGAYDFQDTDYRSLMRGWLARVPAAGALLFCHPGLDLTGAPPQEPPDAIAAARQREQAYLASDVFARDLADAGMVLSRRWPGAAGPG